MTTLSLKGLLFSYLGLLTLVVLFTLGAKNCGITGVEEFFYYSPTFVFACCARVFYIKET